MRVTQPNQFMYLFMYREQPAIREPLAVLRTKEHLPEGARHTLRCFVAMLQAEVGARTSRRCLVKKQKGKV